MLPVALTIAGSDPSGGAGVQADLKTFHQFGVYGQAVLTLVTVQNTRSVDRVELLAPDLVAQQIAAVCSDIPPHAVKTGALGSAAIIEAVASQIQNLAPVVDPVMISKHGAPLIAAEARAALIELLLPLASLVTPNLHEAAALAGIPVEGLPAMKEAARRIAALGPRAVLVKGGHLSGDAVDVLLAGETFYEFSSPRVDTPHTHGTGCTLSAAITALLAKGAPLTDAVDRAKQFLTAAIRSNPGLGHGSGPVNHHAPAGES